jgi:hypothetical protein
VDEDVAEQVHVVAGRRLVVVIRHKSKTTNRNFRLLSRLIRFRGRHDSRDALQLKEIADALTIELEMEA